MATNEQAKSRKFVYPRDCTTKGREKKYRERTLRENPDTLYADNKDQTSGETGERYDLIFYTTLIDGWKSAIRDKYKHVDKVREKFTIFHDEKHNKKYPILTIHFYTTGIVLVQSYENNLKSFEDSFEELKAKVYRERDQAQMNNPNNPPPPPSDNQRRDGEERAEERDQPQTAVEDTSSSITDDFIKLDLK